MKKNSKEGDHLDPKLDVVFKMLFAQPHSKEGLMDIITAVIDPVSPILELEVLNPTLPKENIEEKGVVLDILVKLDDGCRIDIEMQMGNEYFLSQRSTYYLAKMASCQLKAGDSYEMLKPVISIFFLVKKYFETDFEDYHLSFYMQECRQRAFLKSYFIAHFIEIEKLIQGIDQSRHSGRNNSLDLWVRFLYNPDDLTLMEEHMNNPSLNKTKKVIQKTKKTLEILSADPDAKELARIREKGLMRYVSNLAGARAEGLAEGLAKGREEGIAEGIEKGREEGREEGIEKGDRMGRIAILHNLIAFSNIKYDIEQLSKITGLSCEEVAREIEKIANRE
ncbi:MAG: Rpn family recombination-promoting nuclease/putative transposase [Oligoflexales bacterium]|nr:Rpn family recombination-promoting nuclease/putative transposase [Oligoflexales bacterium]